MDALFAHLPTVLLFILVLAVLVLTHELGHFIAARLFGIEVEEFGFGFPPRVFGVNVYGPLYLTREALKVMLPKGSGSIVNTASVAGTHGGAAGVVYTMSKHACVGLTRNTAWYYAKSGVRCNSIIAGGVETNIMASVDPSKIDGEGAQQAGVYGGIIPAMLKAQDIANLALFLASDESKMINGANIPADAGWTAS